MDKGQRLRWGILLSVLAATVGAIVYPDDEPDVPTRPRSQPHRDVPPVRVDAVAAEGQVDWVASEENPFAPRGWIKPPPPLVTVSAVAPTPAEVAPPPPPTLPFKFIGQMVDGADQVIYLGLGEQVLLARTGEVLEGNYKVVSITPAQIEFEFMPSGLRQTLPLPGQDR